MRNYSLEGVSYEAIAEHFKCSARDAQEWAETRPWQLRRPNKSALGHPGLKWWESDHKDPLLLVKLYYPQYLPKKKKVSSEISAGEGKKTITIDAEAYLERRFGDGYVTDKNMKIIDETVDEILDRIDEEEYKTADFVKRMLDRVLTWAS